ncbi:Inner membrane transport protein YajR [bacterium HR37]|nr:Inner membrane transport protein YajR [bacterium HR37]
MRNLTAEEQQVVDNGLNPQETQAIIVVSFIVALRLLGIFLVLPIFSVYAIKYPDATTPLVGIAFGIYALVQSLLQIPFGWASDRIGRKPILLIGLFLFALGSLICGMAENIYQLIFARVIQGCGAVSAVAMAALGDLSRPQVRAQAFTLTGISIGAAFLIGILGGPFLAGKFGFHSLFYILAGLSFFSFIITALFFPQTNERKLKEVTPKLGNITSGNEIRKIYIAAFILSFMLNFFLFIYPLSWTELGLTRAELWKVYLVTSLPSILLVFPYVRYAEKKRKLQPTTIGGWTFISIGLLLYLFGAHNEWLLYTIGGIFFLGHTLFQSLLPAFLTQRVSWESRGSATGIYNLLGFLGASFGGMFAGFLYHLNQRTPLILGLVILAAWAYMGLPKPPDTDSLE